MPPSCALLGRFAIGARVALLWQHNANLRYKCGREMLASACTHSMPSYVTVIRSYDRKDVINYYYDVT